MVEEVKVSIKKTYTVRVVRSGEWWAIEVPEISGVHSQTKRLDKVDFMVRDAIGLMLEIPTDSFDLLMKVELPAEWQERLERVKKMRQEADAMQKEAQQQVAVLVDDLSRRAHLTVRDTGQLLGVSHQRAAQLLHQKPKRSRKVAQPA